eukprot:gene11051-12307_t
MTIEEDWRRVFDLDAVLEVLRRYPSFHRILLQFDEAFLSLSVEIYLFLQDHLLDHSLELQRDFYLVANSTLDGALDDVAGMHVEGDLLVYFGEVMEVATSHSSASALPVLLVHPSSSYASSSSPFQLSCCESTVRELMAAQSWREDQVILLAQPKFHWAALRLSSVSGLGWAAALPVAMDLMRWRPDALSRQEEEKEGRARIGGLWIAQDRLVPMSDKVLVFLGETGSQLDHLLLSHSENSIVHYDTTSNTARILRGSQSQQLTERYGGIFKAKESETIGLILSSMGLDHTLLRRCLLRLQRLLQAARKKYYTFIMGRLNEAKLCNFPEIDVFCLIASEDISTIKPRTFHVPVITPFELEVALGAREWQSCVIHSVEDYLGADDNDLETCLVKVREAAAGEEEDEETRERRLQDEEARQQMLASLDLSHLVVAPEQALTLFDSSAAQFFQGRTFKGLQAEAEEGADHEIRMGLNGIAAGYQQLSSTSTAAATANVRDIEDL